MALGAALGRAYRRRNGFASIVIGLFLLLDATFKILIIPAYLEVLGPRTSTGQTRLSLCVKVSAVVMSGWTVVAWWLSRAIERWRILSAGREPPAASIREAGLAAQRFPLRMTLAWMVEWVALFAIVMLSAGDSLALVSAFFLAAMAAGPLPLSHGLSTWLIRPVLREISLSARAHGVVPQAPPMTLRRRLIFYSVTLCVAPALHMTAVAFAARADGAPAHQGDLLTTVLIFFAGIAVFGIICAVLLATTITEPVAEMSALMRAIARQGDVSRIGRVPLYQSDEVGALAEVTNQMIDRLELTEVERAAANAALLTLNQTLERRVAQRTAELSARNSDLRLLLDNVDQGFFTIDRSGAMSPEHSAILATWFGPIQSGEPISRYFERHDDRFADELALAWQQVVDDILPLTVALGQLPERLTSSGRRYRFSYAAIGPGRADRFLVVVSDETSTVENEKLQREKRETLALFESMVADRAAFGGFMEEASNIVALLVAPRVNDRVVFSRALHTLKGNAAVFGLESVVEICHELESYLADEPALPGAPQLARLKERWDRLSTQVEGLLQRGRHTIEASPEQLADLERAVTSGGAPDELLRMIRDLTLEPVERRLHHFAAQVTRLAQRLDKEISVRVSHDGLRLDPRPLSEIWQAFVHAVRNAVDHGIEPADERIAAGKPRVGRIDLRGGRDGTGVVIEIEDDGRGISWHEIRRHLEARGIPASTHQELEAGLFMGGVSTARGLSETSGRGVGVGTLKAVAQALGGDLELDSQPGRGTRLRLRLPGSAVMPPQGPRSASRGHVSEESGAQNDSKPSLPSGPRTPK